MRNICSRMALVLIVGLVPAGTWAQQANVKAPPAPKEFAFVLSNGYGEGDHYSSDPKVFENLLINMRKAGFNTIHCVYRDERLALCRKHKVKMMIDVLAWKKGCETDIRKPEQRVAVRKICEKVRDDEAVWGYNLWNEALPYFGNPDGKNIDAYVTMLREWDPTHPVWMGTRTVSYANAPKSKPGVHGYYDYAWHRGFQWHFADLLWYFRHVPSQDGYIGRWEQGSKYNWNSFSLNTSIAFGTKVTIWFIGGPFDKNGDVDPKHRFYHLVKIGQETQRLYPELGKFGRPTAVYSTPTTKTHDGKDRNDKDRAANGGVPWRLTPFPKDHWMQIDKGEVLAGFFRYPNGDDAVYVANHNAFAKQSVALTLNKRARVELFQRDSGAWRRLTVKDGHYHFDVRPGGGELLRVSGS